MDSPEFLPNYLTEEEYTHDFDHFMAIQTARAAEKQVSELLLNIDTECMDMFYTDGLDFYASVREAACRKAFGFSARSLRYAQTPHINSWSFAKGKTPKLSGVAG